MITGEVIVFVFVVVLLLVEALLKSEVVLVGGVYAFTYPSSDPFAVIGITKKAEMANTANVFMLKFKFLLFILM